MGVPKIIVPPSARKIKSHSAASLRNPNAMAIANAKRGGALVRVAADEGKEQQKEQFKRRPLTVNTAANIVGKKTRGRTRSWGELAASASAGADGPRYMTRSRAKKISKSMSDLVIL